MLEKMQQGIFRHGHIFSWNALEGVLKLDLGSPTQTDPDVVYENKCVVLIKTRNIVCPIFALPLCVRVCVCVCVCARAPA